MNEIEYPSRLEMIARRQRSGRKRDLLFTCFVMLAAMIGGSGVGAALQGTAVHAAQR